jgi:hypothetical protein
MQSKIGLDMNPFFFDPIKDFIALFTPMALLCTFVFLVAIFLLKKNIIQTLKGADAGRPNVIVRSISHIFTHSEFTTKCRIKNIFRTLTKSSFIFVSILATMVVFIFGGATNQFAEQSIKTTQQNFDFEMIN